MEKEREEFFDNVVCSIIIQNILFAVQTILRADDLQKSEIYYVVAAMR